MAFASAVARFVLLGSILASLLVVTAAPVAADETTGTQLDRVVATAKSKLGARWVHYAKGPAVFDCVGFVYFAFNENGLKDSIGGYRGVKAYYNWFRERGLASTSNPQPGDLIVWGKFTHLGIYLAPDLAISALVNPYGVSIHPIRRSWIGMSVKAYLHTQIER